MSLMFIYAHIKLLFALLSSGDLFFPGNIDGLSNILKIYSTLYNYMQDKMLVFELNECSFYI